MQLKDGHAQQPIRIAVLCDYLEEGWASMDLVAAMIVEQLKKHHAQALTVEKIIPKYKPGFARLPRFGSKPVARNFDRLVNRFFHYPRFVRKLVKENRFDLYHVVDHSYSQLVLELPKGRSLVTCHDLDTFRSLLEPLKEPRPRWFRAMASKILKGMSQASAICCNSVATRDSILNYKLSEPERLKVIYLGVHPECSPEPDPQADQRVIQWLGPKREGAPPDLLHVGSNIPRKRIDLLLKIFAEIHKVLPEARLIKVGGALPPEFERQARELGIFDSIVMVPFFDSKSQHWRADIAAIYRRATLVLLPSDAEGFGFPVAEALASGVPLLASDIDALKEVGGDAVVYRPVGDIAGWTEAALTLIQEAKEPSEAILKRRQIGFDQAKRYSWSTHVDQLVAFYHETLAKL